MLAYLRGDGPRPARRALAVLEVTAEPYAVIEAVVDLEGAQGEVLSWKEVRPGAGLGWGRGLDLLDSLGWGSAGHRDGLAGVACCPRRRRRQRSCPLPAAARRARPAPPQMVGVQPCLTIDDVVESEERLKANPEFLALMASRYGITDMQLLAVDPW